MLNGYPQDSVSAKDYRKTLDIYTRSQRLKLANGQVVPWVDENLNPLTGVVNGFRWCLLGGGMDFYVTGFLVSLAMAALLLGTGLWYFRKTERQFADVI